MVGKDEALKAVGIERRIVECKAQNLRVRVGDVKIDIKKGIMDKNDKISIDGYEPMWIQEVTIHLSIWEAPKIILSGLIKTKVKG